jgi:hypothetical protein
LFKEWPDAFKDLGIDSEESLVKELNDNWMHRDKIPFLLVGVHEGKAIATGKLPLSIRARTCMSLY